MNVPVTINQLDAGKVKAFYMTHSSGWHEGTKPVDGKNDPSTNFDEVKDCFVENGRRAAISAIVPFLPYIGSYEEENKKITFDVAFGYYDDSYQSGTTENNNMTTYAKSGINARFDFLHRLEILQSLDNTEAINNFSNEIRAAIKKTIPLCNNNHNLFVAVSCSKTITGDKYYIVCGLYTSLPDASSSVEKQFINNGFVLAHSARKGVICLSGLAFNNTSLSRDPDIDTYNFCLKDIQNGDIDCKIANIYEYSNLTARIWHGIFERVKRNVHGTICLIVDSSWELAKDDGFDGSAKMDLSISLTYGPGESGSIAFENNVDLFISMLDLDGITVVNSIGQIKAYNLFCKTENMTNTVLGGARRRAYNTITNSKNSHYIGAYFQSQEGEVEFYNFKDHETYKYFDPEIMAKPAINPEEKEIAENNKKIMYDGDIAANAFSSPDVQQLGQLIKQLDATHWKLNNFYFEPEIAKKLAEFVKNKSSIIGKSKYYLCELISVVSTCLIGNSYGYSYDAEEDYEIIIKLIKEEDWKFFFEKKYYYLNDLLSDLIDCSRLNRLQKLMMDEDLVANIPVEYKDKIKSLNDKDLIKQLYDLNDENSLTNASTENNTGVD